MKRDTYCRFGCRGVSLRRIALEHPIEPCYHSALSTRGVLGLRLRRTCDLAVSAAEPRTWQYYWRRSVSTHPDCSTCAHACIASRLRRTHVGRHDVRFLVLGKEAGAITYARFEYLTTSTDRGPPVRPASPVPRPAPDPDRPSRPDPIDLERSRLGISSAVRLYTAA